MKTKIISVLCVIAFISLFISSIARAESWVLWLKFELAGAPPNVRSETSWEIIGAYSDHNQCLQAQKKVWQVIRNHAVEDKEKYGAISEIKEVPYELIIIIFKDPKEIMSSSQTLYCLPGALDPREKK